MTTQRHRNLQLLGPRRYQTCRRVRQRVPHVQREGVVLATVRLIGDHDDVPPVGQLWISRPVPRVELVDQREDEAVIAL